MKTINLLIVDDHPMIREGLVAMLTPYPDIRIVGTCTDGEEAIEAVGRLCPDIVLMDIKMGKINGFEATREIVTSYPGVKVIMLTIFEDAESIRMALQSGASGYMLKQATREKLVESIRRAFKGETIIDSMLLSQLVTDYTRLAQGYVPLSQSSAARESTELTPRESEVARYLAQGLTNKEISAKTHLAVDTVKTHLRSIYRKLGVKKRSQAITELLGGRYSGY
ncbi:MAG: response regulator transcription factor [Peptococcaceae bacterium]|nr:response regulator transcription factor [Peptococcaceae bacterium]